MHRETQIECEFKWRIWSVYKAVDMSLDFSRRLQEPCIDLIDYQWLKTLLENYDSHRELMLTVKLTRALSETLQYVKIGKALKKKTKKKRAVLIVEANVFTTLTCAWTLRLFDQQIFIVQLNCQIHPRAWKKLELPLVLWLVRGFFWLVLVNHLVRRWLS